MIKLKLQIPNQQKGVSLIITFFIMVIILAVVISISILLYSQLKVIRNVGNSVVSFYAADSGIEKVLFYDRKGLPKLGTDEEGNDILGKRGLCTIYPYSGSTNGSACPAPTDIEGLDSSIYCTPDPRYTTPQQGIVNPSKGCDPNVCDDCEIAFSTTFDNRMYSVKASVRPSADGKSSDFVINSKGVYADTERQIKTSLTVKHNEGAISIKDACANPKSYPQGYSISITANVTINILADTIGGANVSIRDAEGYYYDANGNKKTKTQEYFAMACGPADGSTYTCSYKSDPWHADWPAGSGNCESSEDCASGYYCSPKGKCTKAVTAQIYYVSMDAYDTMETPNHKILPVVLPYPMCML